MSSTISIACIISGFFFGALAGSPSGPLGLYGFTNDFPSTYVPKLVWSLNRGSSTNFFSSRLIKDTLLWRVGDWYVTVLPKDLRGLDSDGGGGDTRLGTTLGVGDCLKVASLTWAISSSSPKSIDSKYSLSFSFPALCSGVTGRGGRGFGALGFLSNLPILQRIDYKLLSSFTSSEIYRNLTLRAPFKIVADISNLSEKMSIAPDKRGYPHNFFLYLHRNICCGAH